MKTNLYRFQYTFEGKDYTDYVVASNPNRALFIFTQYYPHVKGLTAELFATVLI